MVNVNSLESEILRRQAEATSKHRLAQSLYASAESHEKSGNEAQARIDRESAERYEHDAELEEQQAGIYEAEIFTRRSRASEIDKQIDQLKREYDQKLADLESKKKSILG